jgi:nicotinic acid mononucleotide adenylyltransferase
MKAQILKRFEDEINSLERELHTQLPKEIQRAREFGDLRENAEYKAAKERQVFLNARIGQLKKRVAEISLINLDKIPSDKVTMVEIPALAISSTECRDRKRRGEPVWYLVPDGVVQYIAKNHLYASSEPHDSH